VVAELEGGGGPHKAVSSSMAAVTSCFCLMGEAEQSNKLDSSPSPHPPPKSGKSLWKMSSAGDLEMSEAPGMICFSWCMGQLRMSFPGLGGEGSRTGWK